MKVFTHAASIATDMKIQSYRLGYSVIVKLETSNVLNSKPNGDLLYWLNMDNQDYFWKKLEENLKYSVPNFIKNGFR